MEELNALLNEKRFDIKKRIITLLVLLIAYLMIFNLNGFFLAMGTSIFKVIFMIEFALAVTLLGTLILTLTEISIAIAELERAAGAKDVIDHRKTIFFVFLWMTAFPYVQKHLNRVIEEKEAA